MLDVKVQGISVFVSIDIFDWKKGAYMAEAATSLNAINLVLTSKIL